MWRAPGAARTPLVHRDRCRLQSSQEWRAGSRRAHSGPLEVAECKGPWSARAETCSLRTRHQVNSVQSPVGQSCKRRPHLTDTGGNTCRPADLVRSRVCYTAPLARHGTGKALTSVSVYASMTSAASSRHSTASCPADSSSGFSCHETLVSIPAAQAGAWRARRLGRAASGVQRAFQSVLPRKTEARGTETTRNCF